MTVAQSAKETEAEGLRCAQPEGEASNMRASEDILERAKTSLKRHDPINQGFYTSMPPEDVQIWKELIAEVEAKNDKIAQDVITIQMHHENVLTLQKEVERLRSDFEHLGIDCSAWQRSAERKDARIKELEAVVEEDLDLMGGRVAYIKRLEAAFLESEAYAHACMGESMPVDGEDWQAAREALERIKAGGKDEA